MAKGGGASVGVINMFSHYDDGHTTLSILNMLKTTESRWINCKVCELHLSIKLLKTKDQCGKYTTSVLPLVGK